MRTTFPKSISQIMIVAFALLAAVLALPALTASAADGAYSTGALLPEYSSSEEVSVLDYKADAKGSKDSASAERRQKQRLRQPPSSGARAGGYI